MREIAETEGVPMILAKDSLSISRHARGIGLISSSETEGVAADVLADQSRPETGEQAMKAALQSAFPPVH